MKSSTFEKETNWTSRKTYSSMDRFKIILDIKKEKFCDLEDMAE